MESLVYGMGPPEGDAEMLYGGVPLGVPRQWRAA
jgi:hypothetical protein